MANLVMFKSQLQEYAQKACMTAPVYDTVMEGPSHEPKFRSSVIVNGVRYDSAPGFHNRKTAEHSAAQVALQELIKLSNGAGYVPNPVHETGLCKNLLQEYAQKLSLPVPVYSVVKAGEGHLAVFTSSVEIAGICYMGGAARSKKEAEIKAARTALLAIQAQACISGSQVDFSSAISSQLEVYSGAKRDRAFEPSSDAVRVVRPKKKKASKKKGGKLRGSTGKEGVPLESSSQVVENCEEKPEDASAVNGKEEQEHPQQETGVEQDLQGKVEVGSDCKDKEQITEDQRNPEPESQEGKQDHEELPAKKEELNLPETEENQAEQKCPLSETAYVGTLIGAVGSS